MMPLQVIFLLGLAIALAMTCQTVTGFGISLLFVPLAMFFVPTKEAIIIGDILGFVCGIILVAEARGKVPWKSTLVLAIAASFGAPLGAILLKFTPAPILRISLGVFILAAAIILYIKFTQGYNPEKHNPKTILSIPIGFISGVINAAISTGGPPVALYINATSPSVAEARRTLICFAALSNFATMSVIFLTGQVNQQSLIVALLILPFLGLGFAMGQYLRPKLSEKAARQVVLGVLIVAAIGSILQAVL